MFQKNSLGFTLLEILLALFIFTIVSMILASGLHTVINAQTATENHAKRLRQLQIALLMLSRDVEQIVNRPVIDASGKEEAAFIGSPRDFTFTRMGFANPKGILLRSNLQRAEYVWQERTLQRAAWPVLDRAPQSLSHARSLLSEVTELRFQYLDKEGTFHDHWPQASPLNQPAQQPLPRAVRVSLVLSQWGKISQLYVIANQENKIAP